MGKDFCVCLAETAPLPVFSNITRTLVTGIKFNRFENQQSLQKEIYARKNYLYFTNISMA